ncbi:MAG: hypothetical protein M9883_18790 [Methylobacteriaceae bacterium]|nr:hypothetical protein [Methylobacteriaceae bacterium]
MHRMSGLAALALLASFDVASAADIEWSVANPFRFYRKESALAGHIKAYDAIVAGNGGVTPADIVERIERRLNDPDCTNKSSYTACAASAGANYERQRMGWAARSVGLDETCYGPVGVGGRYEYRAACSRETGAGFRSEDYINPKSHAVRARLGSALVAANSGKTCAWSWAALPGGQAIGARTAPCAEEILISDIPYPAGAHVIVRAADGGALLAQDNIVVHDLLVVGLGDSFASGEGNPDIPVLFHASRPMSYDGQPKNFPLRRTSPQVYAGDLSTNEGLTTFRRKRAVWTSRDCHRSQYSYQFRVALELALENRHRAVTLVHLACTGAEATEGLFGTKPAREPDEGGPQNVRGQFETLLDLVCVTRVGGKTARFDMAAPIHWGSPDTEPKTYFIKGCKDGKLKRNIDALMLSVGGNDIGFAALVGHSIMDSSGDLADVATLMELFTKQRMTFPPVPAYLSMLDARLLATRDAIARLLGVAPGKVVQTGYERMQVNENDALCSGARGMELHNKFGFRAERLATVDAYARDFFKRLACLSVGGANCPADVHGHTGFNFVTSHQPRFVGHGVCAAKAGEIADFVVPHENGGSFGPYAPDNYLPYAHKRRLFVSVDDAFMTANSHDERPNCSFWNQPCAWPTDKVQLGFAALYSGAFHRTAEAHAIVADEVLKVVRPQLEAAGK